MEGTGSVCAADDKEAEERKEQRHEAVQEQDEIQAPLSSGLARATHRRDTLPPAEAEERAAPLWHCWHVFSSTALHVRDVLFCVWGFGAGRQPHPYSYNNIRYTQY